tara:strand:- start:583 stop:921 length:339 start_codon:yes stop_codon:yes gene_type:complete
MSGRLGAGELGANSWNVIYECPTNRKYASIKIHVANRSAGDAMIDIALSSGDGTTVTAEEYIEYQTMIVSNGSIERSGIVTANGTKVMCRSDVNDCTALVHGIEVLDPTATP